MTVMKTIAEKQKTAFDNLKDKLGYTNRMEAPSLEKIVVNVGVGSIKDKSKIEIIGDRLKRITGQHPVETTAKQSIAAFGIREGNHVGFQVTLRGKRMKNFLDKLIDIALPRTKDFRGLSVKSIDEMGNYTLGILEHTIFPETSDEEIKNVFGMSVTIVTTATNKSEAEAFLEYLGFPFKDKEKISD